MMQTGFITPDRHADGQSRSALRFFATVVAALALAGAVAVLLITTLGRPATPGTHFPPAFFVSTLLLFSGSYGLRKAIRFVRMERQREFRRWLMISLMFGSLFVGVQIYAMACLMPHNRTPDAASTGVTAFVLALASLHAMHFTVAMLFLSLVTVRTFADRYDHEYYWGVKACAWFWHALGIVWIAILAVFAITA
jgi:cytochrome c oxidase subunit III